jgi:GTP 3',8-cyclase
VAGPAINFRTPDYQGEVGLISNKDGHQCPNCNRLRLTADGKLRPCLLSPAEFDLKGPMRLGLGDDLLAYLFQEAMGLKFDQARVAPELSLLPGFPMVSVGG